MKVSTLLATAAAVATTAAAGGLASRSAESNPSQSAWYAQLRKPPYQPPGQLFPVVWPALYADIAAVSATTIDGLQDQGQARQARVYTTALGINLVLNGSWTWLFFNRRKLATSAAVAAALTASSADLTRRAVAVRAPRGALLAPYPLWCAFATVLSTHIWLLNRSGASRETILFNHCSRRAA